MKKIAYLILAALLAVSVTACKQQTGESSTTENSVQSSVDESSEIQSQDEPIPDTSEYSPDEISEESSDSEETPYEYFVTGKYDFEYVVVNDKCLLTKYHGGSSESDKNVVVPETLSIDGKDYPTVIGAGCFMDTEITTLVLPDNITEIPDNMCKNCKQLSTVTFSNVESIGAEAFYYCENYKVQMSDLNNGHPEKIKSMGKNAFSLSGLYGKVTITPDLAIDDATFNCCKKITEIEIAEGVSIVPDHIFADCESVTKITLPESLRSIGKRAFFCTNISSIIIPKNVIELGDYFVGSNTINNRFNFTGVIIGYRGSVAEEYAAKRNISFTPLD